MPGMTAYTGLLNIGQPKPGETRWLPRPAARSARSSARSASCAAVAWSYPVADKVRYITEELGFDVGLDHRALDFAEQLHAAVPNGIDIYFECRRARVGRGVSAQQVRAHSGLRRSRIARHRATARDRPPADPHALDPQPARCAAKSATSLISSRIPARRQWPAGAGKIKSREDIILGSRSAGGSPAQGVELRQAAGEGRQEANPSTPGAARLHSSRDRQVASSLGATSVVWLRRRGAPAENGNHRWGFVVGGQRWPAMPNASGVQFHDAAARRGQPAKPSGTIAVSQRRHRLRQRSSVSSSSRPRCGRQRRRPASPGNIVSRIASISTRSRPPPPMHRPAAPAPMVDRIAGPHRRVPAAF